MNETIMRPLVSIVIPSFNHGRYIQKCIEGVLSQDYQNIELIIIDDGSTDDSTVKIEQMASACKDRFARFEFRSRPNKGLCATLNEALEWTRGSYFTVVDSDDILLPARTSVAVSVIEDDPGLAGVSTGYKLIDAEGASLAIVRPPPTTYDFDDIIGRSRPLDIISSSMLARLELVQAAGGYKTGLYIEDWYMWLKLTEAGRKLKIISEPLVCYRQHETNISKDALEMFESRKAILGLFPQYEGFRLTMSRIYLAAGIEFARKDRPKALGFLVGAIKQDSSIFLDGRFWITVLRICAPAALIETLKENTTLKRVLSGVVPKRS
jgi:alpha-1,3-rhamnosyltransferase